MATILSDIREDHKADSTTADQTSVAMQVHQQLENAVNFEGSSDEKKAKALLATLGIDYDAITKEQFVNTHREMAPTSQEPAAVAITSASNASTSSAIPVRSQRSFLLDVMYSFIRHTSKTTLAALCVIAQVSQVS